MHYKAHKESKSRAKSKEQRAKSKSQRANSKGKEKEQIAKQIAKNEKTKTNLKMENTMAASNEIVDIVIDIPKPVMSTFSRDIVLDAVKRLDAR